MISVTVKYILAGVALVLIVLAATRGFVGLQARTWLLVAAIFIVISLWLFMRA